ncbi:MAG: VOC family protein [Synechococcales bacterium]|nr:VOC family protein [Synechococcales bacterium]
MVATYMSSAVADAELSTAESVDNLPFHLSMCVNDLDEARHFYCNILGLEERRASKTSAHFDFYGCQLTCHHVPGFSAKNLQREVDAENVPVPHFGVALPYAEFEKLKNSLIANDIQFVLRPHVRFIGKGHEQHVMFVEDPSGHGIELKSFTKAPAKTWM